MTFKDIGKDIPKSENEVIVQKVASARCFWHVFAKIPRHTSQNAITEGDGILTCDCSVSSQLQNEFVIKWRITT